MKNIGTIVDKSFKEASDKAMELEEYDISAEDGLLVKNFKDGTRVILKHLKST